MDTDELTEMAYESICLAGETSACLRAELGAACSRYRNEDDYLRGILAHVRRIEKAPQNYIDEWNLPEDEELAFAPNVRTLRWHIEKTLAVPIADRGTPPFAKEGRPRKVEGLKITEKQGQYLAFIHNYAVMSGRSPAQSDIQKFFGTTPPTVHQMILNLEAKGLLSRVPGHARSLQVLLPPEKLPVLKPKASN